MLKRKLNLVYAHGTPKSTPSKTTLDSEYFLAANINTEAQEVRNPEQDCNKVITLRPEVESKYDTEETSRVKGYFALGRAKGRNVTFQIYSPHSSVKSKFPPKSLVNAVALFSKVLVDEGYSIKPKGIQFTTRLS